MNGITELKKTLLGEQVKVGLGSVDESLLVKKGGCGREEEDRRKGLSHHWNPYESFHRSLGIVNPCCVHFVVVSRKMVQKKVNKHCFLKQGHRRKVTDGVSVIFQKNRKRLLFGSILLVGTYVTWKTESLDEHIEVTTFV